ncbi:MptD family putative ECF transporter S component, partial [Streptococcus pneumoniae]
MDNKKLKVKDLVSIGVFGVIYFTFMFGVGMMGLIPIL